jgi:hypothetical protein
MIELLSDHLTADEMVLRLNLRTKEVLGSLADCSKWRSSDNANLFVRTPYICVLNHDDMVKLHYARSVTSIPVKNRDQVCSPSSPSRALFCSAGLMRCQCDDRGP